MMVGDGRRALFWFRLVFYPLAAVIVTLLLLHGRVEGGVDDPVAAPPLHRVVGETDDHEPIVLKFDDDGVLRSWEVRLIGSCDDGSLEDHIWAPTDTGAPARVTRRGDRVDAVERTWLHDDTIGRTDRIEVRLRARVTPGAVTGTLWFSKRVERRARATAHCSSPRVAFAARR